MPAGLDATITTEQAARQLDPEEAMLLRRIRADDLDAFEAFFTRYRGPVYATAYAVLGDRHAAEEVLQDTFAKAYQWRRRLHPDASPLPWLHRVALNFSYTRLGRRRLPWEPISETVARLLRDREAGPADSAEREELRVDRPRRDRVAAAQAPRRHRSLLPARAEHQRDGRDPGDPAGNREVPAPLRPAVAARAPGGRSPVRRRLRAGRHAGGRRSRGARGMIRISGATGLPRPPGRPGRLRDAGRRPALATDGSGRRARARPRRTLSRHARPTWRDGARPPRAAPPQRGDPARRARPAAGRGCGPARRAAPRALALDVLPPGVALAVIWWSLVGDRRACTGHSRFSTTGRRSLGRVGLSDADRDSSPRGTRAGRAGGPLDPGARRSLPRPSSSLVPARRRASSTNGVASGRRGADQRAGGGGAPEARVTWR